MATTVSSPEREWAEGVRQSYDAQVADGEVMPRLTPELFTARENLSTATGRELGRLGLKIIWRSYGEGYLFELHPGEVGPNG